MRILDKLLDKLKLYKMCCRKFLIELVSKRLRAEVESSDSLDIQVTGIEVRSKFPDLPGLQQRSISWNLCISFSVSTLISGYVDQSIWIKLFQSS